MTYLERNELRAELGVLRAELGEYRQALGLQVLDVFTDGNNSESELSPASGKVASTVQQHQRADPVLGLRQEHHPPVGCGDGQRRGNLQQPQDGQLRQVLSAGQPHFRVPNANTDSQNVQTEGQSKKRKLVTSINQEHNPFLGSGSSSSDTVESYHLFEFISMKLLSTDRSELLKDIRECVKKIIQEGMDNVFIPAHAIPEDLTTSYLKSIGIQSPETQQRLQQLQQCLVEQEINIVNPVHTATVVAPGKTMLEKTTVADGLVHAIDGNGVIAIANQLDTRKQILRGFRTFLGMVFVEGRSPTTEQRLDSSANSEVVVIDRKEMEQQVQELRDRMDRMEKETQYCTIS